MAVIYVKSQKCTDLQEAENLTLREAAALVNGSLRPEQLSPSKQAQITGSLSEPNEILLDLPDPKTVLWNQEDLQEPIRIASPYPVSIRGNGACLDGCHAAAGIQIESSHVTIWDLHFKGFFFAVRIDSREKHIEDIALKRCSFQELDMAGVCVGASESGGIIQNVDVDSCEFIGAEELEAASLQKYTMSIMVQAAMAQGRRTVRDCLLDGMTIQNNRFTGSARININITAVFQERVYEDTGTQFENCRISGLRIENNYMKSGWDAVINYLGASRNSRSCSLENVSICRNEIYFRAWGIYLAAGEPGLNGYSEDCRLSHCRIEENTIELYEKVGRPSGGIVLNGGRTDFEPAVVKRCCQSHIHICRNRITGSDRGIMLTAAHAMVDSEPPAILEGCEIQDVIIEENEIRNVKKPFLLAAAYLEGRRVVLHYGLPPKTKIYAPLRREHQSVSLTAQNNRIDHVQIRRNHMTETEYMLVAAASIARGHSLSRQNILGADIIFEDNTFEESEEHILICEESHEDWAAGEGNRTEAVFKELAIPRQTGVLKA